METEGQIQPIGGRRVARPATVEPCPRCGEAIGTNYVTCASCFMAIERIWLADWQALLAVEQLAVGSADEQLLAQVVLGEYGRHPWTVLDIAMSLCRCQTCGSELGEAYHDCAECGQAFGQSLASEFNITANEHALHVGRWILRYPHRNSSNINTAWRLTMPRLLTGWLPSTAQAQRMMNLLKAGKIETVRQQIQQVDDAIRRQNS
jgi:hypothetical protein